MKELREMFLCCFVIFWLNNFFESSFSIDIKIKKSFEYFRSRDVEKEFNS